MFEKKMVELKRELSHQMNVRSLFLRESQESMIKVLEEVDYRIINLRISIKLLENKDV